ncbi:MAG: nitroreductase family protein [Thermoplasmatota archaeon]
MDVSEAIRRRRTVRRYEKRAVAPAVLRRLLEAARLAPSGMNLQPWELIVVTSEEVRRALVPACNNQRQVAEAPVVICGVDDPEAKWARVDLALAMEHIALEAVELGLGTCYIGSFKPESVRAVLGIPPQKQVVMLLTVGHPAEAPPDKEKKPLEALVHWERYGNRA